jgi:hypothetical protein
MNFNFKLLSASHNGSLFVYTESLRRLITSSSHAGPLQGNAGSQLENAQPESLFGGRLCSWAAKQKVILVTEPARLSVTYSSVTWAANACHLATVLSCYGLVN